MDKRDKEFLTYLSGYVTAHKKDLMEKVLSQRTRYFTLVLENIYKPHNASAVLRTADCFGIQDVHIIEEVNAYKVNPYVTRGSAQWVDIYKYDNQEGNAVNSCFETLRARGYKILATSPNAKNTAIQDLQPDQPTALVFGNEHEGVSQEVLAAVDGSVHIPMRGFTESFNISVSAAICLFALQEKIKDTLLANYHLDEKEKELLRYKWYQAIVKNANIHKKIFFQNR